MKRDTRPEALARRLFGSGIGIYPIPMTFEELRGIVAAAIRRERAACLRAVLAKHATSARNEVVLRYNAGIMMAARAIRARNRRPK